MDPDEPEYLQCNQDLISAKGYGFANLADNPLESRIILKPVGPHAFRQVPTGISYGALGEVLTFETTPDVTKASTANQYWLRK